MSYNPPAIKSNQTKSYKYKSNQIKLLSLLNEPLSNGFANFTSLCVVIGVGVALRQWVRSISFPGSTPKIIERRRRKMRNWSFIYCWNVKYAWAPFQQVNVLFPIDRNGHCLHWTALIYCCIKRVTCRNGVQWDFTFQPEFRILRLRRSIIFAHHEQ